MKLFRNKIFIASIWIAIVATVPAAAGELKIQGRVESAYGHGPVPIGVSAILAVVSVPSTVGVYAVVPLQSYGTNQTSGLVLVTQTVTDENGRFSVDGLKRGNYLITIMPDDPATFGPAQTILSVPTAPTRSGGPDGTLNFFVPYFGPIAL